MVCFTTLLTVSLNEQKFLILMCSKWSFISPVLAVMDSLKKKTYSKAKSYSPLLFSRGLLQFKFIVRLEFMLWVA